MADNFDGNISQHLWLVYLDRNNILILVSIGQFLNYENIGVNLDCQLAITI